jgi:hypothetical protein
MTRILTSGLFQFYEDEDTSSMPLFASVSDMSDIRKALVRKDSGKY